VTNLAWALRDRASLSAAEIGGMYAVRRSLQAEGQDRAGFLTDLAEQERVVLAVDDDGRVRGYTTLVVAHDRQGPALLTGETCEEREATGSQALQLGWLAAAMAAFDEHGPLDWVMTASTPRSFRALPTYFRKFWPSPSGPTPAPTQRRLDALGVLRWGARYDRGIVRLRRAQHRADAVEDPLDRFFRSRNPGWERGDELACLAEVRPENLTETGHRAVRRLSWSRSD
jgi:hypothetical protein